MRVLLGKRGTVICTLSVPKTYPQEGSVSLVSVHGGYGDDNTMDVDVSLSQQFWHQVTSLELKIFISNPALISSLVTVLKRKLQYKSLFTSTFITSSKKHEKISKQRMSNPLYIHNFNLLTALWKNHFFVTANLLYTCMF